MFLNNYTHNIIHRSQTLLYSSEPWHIYRALVKIVIFLTSAKGSLGYKFSGEKEWSFIYFLKYILISIYLNGDILEYV